LAGVAVDVDRIGDIQGRPAAGFVIEAGDEPGKVIGAGALA